MQRNSLSRLPSQVVAQVQVARVVPEIPTVHRVGVAMVMDHRQVRRPVDVQNLATWAEMKTDVRPKVVRRAIPMADAAVGDAMNSAGRPD